MPVELGLSPDSRWNTDLAGLADAAHQAGFTSLGAVGDWVDAGSPALFAEAGLHCHEVVGLVLSDDEAAVVPRAELLAERASIMKAPWVLTTFRTGLTDATARVIQRCASIFVDAGAKMAAEFSPLGPVTSIQKGLDVVKVAGSDRAGLMIDTWHFFHGDSTWEDLARVPLDQIAYVQFDDALAPASSNAVHETMHRRAMPGEGVLDLHRFATTLLDRGWEGVASVEVLSEELRALPITEVAQRAFDTAGQYWLA